MRAPCPLYTKVVCNNLCGCLAGDVRVVDTAKVSVSIVDVVPVAGEIGHMHQPSAEVDVAINHSVNDLDLDID